MKNFINRSFLIINLYKLQYPLQFVLIIAVILRILAGFFSKGFVFSDDHFCVIEQAQDWIYGFSHDLNKHDPPMHSVFYSGLHYYLFLFLEKLGITNPDIKMTINRLIHGLYSVLTVYYAYKITEIISSRKNAYRVGIILATLWFMPFLCTKDLVEAVCIPLCLGAFYHLLKIDVQKNHHYKHWIFAGALLGIAFVLRMHTILFAGGAGIILLYKRYWVGSFLFAFSYLIIVSTIQGGIDAYFFEYPFHSVVAYFQYNSTHAYSYIVGPFYQYFLVILGFLIPPVSIFLMYGYFKARKIEPIIFTAGLVFFLFHSYFPNKQERFILPLLPFIVILGVIGWENYIETSDFWKKRQKWLHVSWRIFWVINLATCTLLIFTYSKKSQIEPLVYLSHKIPLRGIILETANNGSDLPAAFYLGRFASSYPYYKQRLPEIEKLELQGRINAKDAIILYLLPHGKPIEQLKAEIEEMKKYPEYIVFSGSSQLQERVAHVKTYFPNLTFEKEIEPAFYDEILHFLNPGIHKDQHVSIFKIN